MSDKMRGKSERQLREIIRIGYPGVYTIWGWDGGFKKSRVARARRTLAKRRKP